MSSTNQVNATAIWTALTPEQQEFTKEMANQAFSVDSFVFHSTLENTPDHYFAYNTLKYLKKFFGADFEMPHNMSLEKAKAFVEKASELEVFIEEDEDQFILLFSMENDQGVTMEMSLQIFISGDVVTSAAIVEVLNQQGFRDLEKEIIATQEFYERTSKGDASNVKASMVTPNFISDQKVNHSAQSVRRKSSVQLSTDYAQAAYKLLKNSGRHFSTSMNLINEFVTVQNLLGMDEDELKLFSEAAGGLQAKAMNARKIIEEFKRPIENRAKAKLGEEKFPKSMKASRVNVDRHSGAWHKMAYAYGIDLWNERLTEGDKKSLIRAVTTDKERDQLAMLNEEFAVGLSQELEKACAPLGENALMKMAVAEYLRKYNDPKENEGGHKTLWDIFEDGLVQALHLYENRDKGVIVYSAPKADTPAFFVNADDEVRINGLAEIQNIHVGDVLNIVPVNGVMCLVLESGNFAVSGAKTSRAFPVVPETHSYTAVVKHINHGQKALEGLSIRVGDVELLGGAPTPPTEEEDVIVDFELTADALAFVDNVIATEGSDHPFIVQEFYVHHGVLHMMSEGTLFPVSHVNEITVAVSSEPVRVHMTELKGGQAFCK